MRTILGRVVMKPVPRILAVTTILFSLSCFTSSVAEAQRRRPNILVIVTDDMGYGDIGIHGSKDIPTPNIDALAKVGIRFTDAYVSGPYCSPTRATRNDCPDSRPTNCQV